MQFLQRTLFALLLAIAAMGAIRADDTAPAPILLGEAPANAMTFDGAAADNRIIPLPTESATAPTPIPEPAGVGVLVAALAAACAALRVRAKRARSSNKTDPKPPANTP